jgi:predicted kinase
MNGSVGTLVLICGLSFSGKSTLAKAITTKFGYEEIDVDEVGAKLYELNMDDERLEELDWDRVYNEADRLIGTRLRSGATVVDASRNFTKQERERAQQVAMRSNAQLVTIYVDTPEEIARQRRLSNKTSRARRDITDAQFDEIVQIMQPPTEDEKPLVFHHADDVDSWLPVLARRLGRHAD